MADVHTTEIRSYNIWMAKLFFAYLLNHKSDR